MYFVTYRTQRNKVLTFECHRVWVKHSFQLPRIRRETHWFSGNFCPTTDIYITSKSQGFLGSASSKILNCNFSSRLICEKTVYTFINKTVTTKTTSAIYRVICVNIVFMALFSLQQIIFEFFCFLNVYFTSHLLLSLKTTDESS